MREEIWNDENLVRIIKEGGIAVIPTDTIYGIVCLASREDLVERVYKIRKRPLDKPCIIMISDLSDLKKFKIELTEKQQMIASEYWPGPVSIILDCPEEEFTYLHRGKKTLAFRVPSAPAFRELLKATGPLLAPSANTAEHEVSHNIAEAQSYFGSLVDVYADGGEVTRSPSLVIRLHGDSTTNIVRG